MCFRCPGQEKRNLTVSVVKCPKCGAEVEIFSDETRVRCQKCGERVCQESTPSCYQWCKSARDCLGEEKWRALVGKNA